MWLGLCKRLALVAVIAVCLPRYARGADDASPGDEPLPKIFEEFSLLGATADSGKLSGSTAPSEAKPSVVPASVAPAVAAPVSSAPEPPPAPSAAVLSAYAFQPPPNAPPATEVAPPPPGDAPAPGSGHASESSPSIMPSPLMPPGAIMANSPNGCGGPPETVFDSCCEPPVECEPVCCDHRCQFISGVEATFFHVDVHGMSASATSANEFAGHPYQMSNGSGYDNWTFSPRIFAGVQDGCWGVMGRFWYLSDSSGRLDPFFPAGNAAGDYSSERIKAYTADFEVFRALCVANSKVNVFLGGRYASFEAEQAYDTTRLTTPSEIAYTSAFSDFSFSGLGITTGFQGRTPLTCDGCFNLLWGLRGSVIWGDSGRAIQAGASVIDTFNSGTTVNAAYTSNDFTTAFMVEALAGFQWDHQLACLPLSAYLRIAFEYQYWNLGGGGSASTGSTAFATPGTATSRAQIGDPDANFLGFMIGTGFNW